MGEKYADKFESLFFNEIEVRVKYLEEVIVLLPSEERTDLFFAVHEEDANLQLLRELHPSISW